MAVHRPLAVLVKQETKQTALVEIFLCIVSLNGKCTHNSALYCSFCVLVENVAYSHSGISLSQSHSFWMALQCTKTDSHPLQRTTMHANKLLWIVVCFVRNNASCPSFCSADLVAHCKCTTLIARLNSWANVHNAAYKTNKVWMGPFICTQPCYLQLYLDRVDLLHRSEYVSWACASCFLPFLILYITYFGGYIKNLLQNVVIFMQEKLYLLQLNLSKVKKKMKLSNSNQSLLQKKENNLAVISICFCSSDCDYDWKALLFYFYFFDLWW